MDASSADLGKKTSRIVAVTLALMLFASVVVVALMGQSDHHENTLTKQAELGQRVKGFEAEVMRHRQLLETIQAFSASSQRIDRNEWQFFVSGLEVRKRYPAMLELSVLAYPEAATDGELNLEWKGAPLRNLPASMKDLQPVFVVTGAQEVIATTPTTLEPGQYTGAQIASLQLGEFVSRTAHPAPESPTHLEVLAPIIAHVPGVGFAADRLVALVKARFSLDVLLASQGRSASGNWHLTLQFDASEPDDGVLAEASSELLGVRTWIRGVPATTPPFHRMYGDTLVALFGMLLLSAVVTFVTGWLSHLAQRQVKVAEDWRHKAEESFASTRELEEKALKASWKYTRDLEDANCNLRESLGVLQRANEELADTRKFGGQNLSMLVHDMRSPLAAILGYSELLFIKLPDQSESVRRAIKSIQASVRQLDGMVVTMLDVAKLQERRMLLNLELVDLNEMLEATLSALAPLLEGRRIHLRVPPGTRVHADATLLRRVMQNLITNATKYTPAGSAIDIGAEALPDGVQITVRDFGEGLPPERAESLFDVFTRDQRDNSTGSGLGLAFCRMAMQAHKGSIRYVSAAGGGARFELFFPNKEADPELDRVSDPEALVPADPPPAQE